MATITSVQALVTKTGAFDGASLDISALSGDWTLCVEVQAAGPDTVARFQFSDSVDAFTTVVAVACFHVAGGIAKSASKKYSFKKEDFVDARFNVSSAVLRLSLTRLTGTSPTVSYSAWLER